MLLSGVGIWRFSRNRAEAPLPPIEVVPLVGLTDLEFKPAFSPDGNQVAFSVGGPENSGIYTTVVGGEKSLRLTSNSGDCCPRWSPDGRQVAFFRTSHEGVAIYVIPAFGGTEHRLYSGPAGFFHRALDWSPDGKVLAFTESQCGQDPLLDCVAFARRFHHTTAYVTVSQEYRLWPCLLARRLRPWPSSEELLRVWWRTSMSCPPQVAHPSG